MVILPSIHAQGSGRLNLSLPPATIKSTLTCITVKHANDVNAAAHHDLPRQKLRVFLRGYDQASSIPAADLQVGKKVTIHHDKGNLYYAFAVAVKNLRGQLLGRVARELSKGCFKLLRQIQSTNFQLTATFSQLVTEVGKYDNYSNSTAVHIELYYFVCRADDDDGHVRQK